MSRNSDTYVTTYLIYFSFTIFYKAKILISNGHSSFNMGVRIVVFQYKIFEFKSKYI